MGHSLSIFELFLSVIFLSAFYVIPVGLSFVIMKYISRKDHSPYSFQTFLWLCLPGFLYGFLEGVMSHQGLNFLLVLPCLALFGIAAVILLRRINLAAFVATGCALALVLWILVPNAVIRLM